MLLNEWLFSILYKMVIFLHQKLFSAFSFFKSKIWNKIWSMTIRFAESSKSHSAHALLLFSDTVYSEIEGGGGPGSSEMRPPLQAHVAAVLLSGTMVGKGFTKGNQQQRLWSWVVHLTMAINSTHRSARWLMAANASVKQRQVKDERMERKDAVSWAPRWLRASCDAGLLHIRV